MTVLTAAQIYAFAATPPDPDAAAHYAELEQALVGFRDPGGSMSRVPPAARTLGAERVPVGPTGRYVPVVPQDRFTGLTPNHPTSDITPTSDLECEHPCLTTNR